MSDEEKKNEEERWQKKAYQKLQPVIQNTKLISKQLDGYAIKIMELCAKFKSPPEWTKLIFWALIMLALCALAYVTILGIWHLFAKIHCLFFATEINTLKTEINTLKDEAKKDNFNELRNALFILAALIGAPFFLWRTWIAQQQSNIAEHQAETARDRAYTELFTKAIEQLGAEKPAKKVIMGEDQDPTTIDDYVPNIEVRIGAIFALERIMKDSEKDAASVVDTLAAYVRENCGKPTLVCEIPQQKDFESTHEWVSAIKDYVGDVWSPGEGSLVARARALRDQPQVNRADINTALTVIGRRPDWLKDPEKFKSQTSEMPDLQNVNFQGWDLRKFDLSWCNLSGANMQGADMVLAQMQGVNMSGAQMQSAIMRGAKIQGSDMAHAEMKDANMLHAKMQGANMSSAKMLEAGMQNAEMQGANMSGAQMQSAIMRGAKMQVANMSGAQMQGANMSGAQMQGAEMSYAEMQEAKMRYALMQGAEMFNAKMQGADMQGTELQGADMKHAKMQEAILQDAKMQGADMAHANMQEAILQDAKMQGANMQDAKIEKVQITSARKTATSVIWVNFTKSKFEFHELQEQLPEMFGHKKHTTLPEGMAIPEHWSEADMRTDEGDAQYEREWEAFKKKIGVE